MLPRKAGQQISFPAMEPPTTPQRETLLGRGENHSGRNYLHPRNGLVVWLERSHEGNFYRRRENCRKAGLWRCGAPISPSLDSVLHRRPINIVDAMSLTIALGGSYASGIEGERERIDGSLFLNRVPGAGRQLKGPDSKSVGLRERAIRSSKRRPQTSKALGHRRDILGARFSCER